MTQYAIRNTHHAPRTPPLLAADQKPPDRPAARDRRRRLPERGAARGALADPVRAGRQSVPGDQRQHGAEYGLRSRHRRVHEAHVLAAAPDGPGERARGRHSRPGALGVGCRLGAGDAPIYGAIVFAGLFFDVVVYTIWLKRRTPYSIIIGGLAGGMPVLAGRTLAVGQIDTVGVMLALGVLFWIPTHIMTFSMRHFDDYRTAGRADLPGRVRVLRHPRHHRGVEPGRGADHGLGRGGHRRQAGAAGGVGCPGPWPCWDSQSSGSCGLRRRPALPCSSSRRSTCSAP